MASHQHHYLSGDTGQFSVRAEGPSLTYQWYYGPGGSGTLLANGIAAGAWWCHPHPPYSRLPMSRRLTRFYYAIVTGVCTAA
jgi:hypothetical protein